MCMLENTTNSDLHRVLLSIISTDTRHFVCHEGGIKSNIRTLEPRLNICEVLDCQNSSPSAPDDSDWAGDTKTREARM